MKQYLLSRKRRGKKKLLVYKCLTGYCLAIRNNITVFLYKLDFGSRCNKPVNAYRWSKFKPFIQSNSLQLSRVIQTTSDKMAKTKQTSVR